MSSRAYCFTINNPTRSKSEMGEWLMEWKTKYIVIGEETAPSTGTRHFQGYVYWTAAKPISSAINKYPGIHFSVARGTAEENFEYCTKEDKEFYQYGKMPRQGKRSDLEMVKAMVADGCSMADVYEIASSFQSVRMAEGMMKYREKKRDFKPTVEWYFGPTGTGKTREAYRVFNGECYVSGKNLKWWEGYDAHSNVLIDDFRKDFCTFHELLRILDRYEYRIECKGGSRQLLARHIIITSCYRPEAVYNTREDIGQLLRRIDVLKYFDGANTETGTDVAGVIIDPATNPYIPEETW